MSLHGDLLQVRLDRNPSYEEHGYVSDHRSRPRVQTRWGRHVRVATHLVSCVPIVVVCVAIVLSALRYLVLLYETMDIVLGERAADEELIDLCGGGAARSSPRMQQACMAASAARASPAFVAALIRAASAFGEEVWRFVYVPVHSFSFVVLVAAFLFLPWLSSLRTFLWPASPTYDSYVGATQPRLVSPEQLFVYHNGTRADPTVRSETQKRMEEGREGDTTSLLKNGSSSCGDSFGKHDIHMRKRGASSPDGSRPASPHGSPQNNPTSSWFPFGRRATAHLHED
jgi:hypothetical protein